MRRRSAAEWLVWLALVLGAVIALFPVYWMLATAVRPQEELFTPGVHLWPAAPQWSNFGRAWELLPFGRWFWNSLVLATVGTGVALLLDLMAGYAFAKFRFRGRDALFWVLLSTMMVPAQVLLVPQFLAVASAGGVDSYWGVLLPRLAEAFGVFLARQFFRELPDELLEAARLDGAGEASIFFRIALPLARPLAAALAIFTWPARWNEFGWPMVILKDQDALTVPVGLHFLRGQYETDWTAIMALTLVSVLPVLALFLWLQRSFVPGLARTGLK